MNIKNVTVAGAGVLGSQIAYQTAYKGFPVKIWVRSEGSIERAKPKLASLHQIYLDTLEAMKTDPSAYCRGLADTPDLSAEQIDALKARAQRAYESLSFTTSFEEAAQNADLVIEAIAENLAEKDAFYKALAPHLPQKTILATNSSTLLPSAIAPLPAGPRSSWRCTLPTRSGATTRPRSWATPAPTRPPSRRSWTLRPPSAWCRSSCTRSSPATS